jgi:hypothetical protein
MQKKYFAKLETSSNRRSEKLEAYSLIETIKTNI